MQSVRCGEISSLFSGRMWKQVCPAAEKPLRTCIQQAGLGFSSVAREECRRPLFWFANWSFPMQKLAQ